MNNRLGIVLSRYPNNESLAKSRIATDDFELMAGIPDLQHSGLIPFDEETIAEFETLLERECRMETM